MASHANKPKQQHAGSKRSRNSSTSNSTTKKQHLTPRDRRQLQAEQQHQQVLHTIVTELSPLVVQNTTINVQASNNKVIDLTQSAAPYTITPHRFYHELPLSQATLDALQASKYNKLTYVQRTTIPAVLCGIGDLLVAAPTGSGKTLAFIIPLIERLYHLQWNNAMDGLAGVVISPTRELAIQIFDVLRVVGCNHSLAAGLVIGGKSYEDEAEKIGRMNILIATPGRLLQHLEQTATLSTEAVQLLVLDEADRLMDMGFKQTINSILTYMPPPAPTVTKALTIDELSTPMQGRQTLLFSATQTRNVSDLARISLQNPRIININVNANALQIDNGLQKDDSKSSGEKSKKTDSTASASTTMLSNTALEQLYCIIPAHLKIDMCWSFIKSHLRCKSIIFVSSTKQVQFMYEVFRRMRPGVPLMKFHGAMKQQARITAYYDFVNKPTACLFATDIAARGLDFPAVDWVLQLDAPDSIEQYIHRIGRTARYKSRGKALLVVEPSEMKLIDKLNAVLTPDGTKPAEQKPAPKPEKPSTADKPSKKPHSPAAPSNALLKRMKVNPLKLRSTQTTIQNYLAAEPELAVTARSAYASYVRSIYLQHDKSVFQLEELPLEELALSYGLPSIPTVDLDTSKHLQKNMSYQLQQYADSSIRQKQIEKQKSLDKQQQEQRSSVDNAPDRVTARHNVLYEKRVQDAAGEDGGSDSDDDLLQSKGQPSVDIDSSTELYSGENNDDSSSESDSDDSDSDDEEQTSTTAAERIALADAEDKQRYAQRLKTLKQRLKKTARQTRQAEAAEHQMDEEGGAQLASASEQEDDSEVSDDDAANDEEEGTAESDADISDIESSEARALKLLQQ